MSPPQTPSSMHTVQILQLPVFLVSLGTLLLFAPAHAELMVGRENMTLVSRRLASVSTPSSVHLFYLYFSEYKKLKQMVLAELVLFHSIPSLLPVTYSNWDGVLCGVLVEVGVENNKGWPWQMFSLKP